MLRLFLALSALSASVLAQTPQSLIPIVPCRVADTRFGTAQYGGSELAAKETRTFTVAANSLCSVPTTATAYVLNVTVVPEKALTYLTAWPAGQTQPNASLLNSPGGAIIANAAIIPAGANGAINLYASDATQVIVDVTGYFVPTPTAQTDFVSIQDFESPTGALGTIDGTQTEFTLSVAPATTPTPAVFLNGIKLRAGVDYWLVGQTLTFNAAPPTGSLLEVDYEATVTARPSVHSPLGRGSEAISPVWIPSRGQIGIKRFLNDLVYYGEPLVWNDGVYRGEPIHLQPIRTVKQ